METTVKNKTDSKIHWSLLSLLRFLRRIKYSVPAPLDNDMQVVNTKLNRECFKVNIWHKDLCEDLSDIAILVIDKNNHFSAHLYYYGTSLATFSHRFLVVKSEEEIVTKIVNTLHNAIQPKQ